MINFYNFLQYLCTVRSKTSIYPRMQINLIEMFLTPFQPSEKHRQKSGNIVSCIGKFLTKKIFSRYTKVPNRSAACLSIFWKKIPDFTFIRDHITVNKKVCRKTLLFSTYTFILPYTTIRNPRVIVLYVIDIQQDGRVE